MTRDPVPSPLTPVPSVDFDRMALRKRARAGLALALALPRPARRPPQRLVFTVTNGRSGSDMLHTLFTAFPDVVSRHEPEPDFRHLRPLVAARPWLARTWLRQVKLPAIAAEGGAVYVETSHMFCKGYLEPMLALGQRFDLVFLKRPAREIALSMAKLPAIPGSGAWAASYYVSPRERTLLPPLPATALSPYQVCYWHALENEARQRHYRALAAREGLRTADILTAELGSAAAATRLFRDLDMDMATLDTARLAGLVQQKINLKTDRKKRIDIDLGRIAEEERAVETMVGVTADPAGPSVVPFPAAMAPR